MYGTPNGIVWNTVKKTVFYVFVVFDKHQHQHQQQQQHCTVVYENIGLVILSYLLRMSDWFTGTVAMTGELKMAFFTVLLIVMGSVCLVTTQNTDFTNDEHSAPATLYTATNMTRMFELIRLEPNLNSPVNWTYELLIHILCEGANETPTMADDCATAVRECGNVMYNTPLFMCSPISILYMIIRMIRDYNEMLYPRRDYNEMLNPGYTPDYLKSLSCGDRFPNDREFRFGCDLMIWDVNLPVTPQNHRYYEMITAGNFHRYRDLWEHPYPGDTPDYVVVKCLKIMNRGFLSTVDQQIECVGNGGYIPPWYERNGYYRAKNQTIIRNRNRNNGGDTSTQAPGS